MKAKQTLQFSDYKAPTYSEIRNEIDKKVGSRPALPTDLPKGDWTEQALKVLKERYLVKDANLNPIETPDEVMWRVAWEVASAEARWGATKKDVMNSAREFYNLMVSRKFLPNSPTLMNAGTGNGLQYSACFVLPVEDSMEGIFDALKYQAIIHKTGGGTGFSFTRLRPSGSLVKTSSGTASGPISFMRIFDAATNEVKQGGKRRGANMGILRVDHPDVMEFIHCKEEGGITNFNISVALTDKFMEAYRNDTEYELINPKTKEVTGKLSAKKAFDEIADGAWRTGDPGLIFIDKINNSTANPVPAIGEIEATNPCVTGDTLVYTNKGLISIEELYLEGIKTNVLSDSRLSDVLFQPTSKILQTGKKQIYILKTKEGYELKLTGDHKVLTERGWIKALDLKDGDEILVSNRKGGFGAEGTLEEGRVIGWLVGDGTMKSNQAVLSFFGYEKQELAPKFANMVSHIVDGKQMISRDYGVSVINVSDRDEARVQSVRLARYMNEIGINNKTKLIIPKNVFKGSEDMQKGFLQGLFTADGHVAGNANKGLSVRLTSISGTLLKDVQRLLLNFGIYSRIYTERRKEAKRFLPDGKGGQKEYVCKAYGDLSISKDSLLKFQKYIGFLSDVKNIKLQIALEGYKDGLYKEKYTAKFIGLIKETTEMVYDLTVPATSSFIANGLVVHNCGEQPLYPFDACNLGSIFLTYFVIKDESLPAGRRVDWEGLKEISRQGVRFLDNVIEVNPYPLEQIRNTVFGIRRIGLGIGGWADMLLELGIPYDSEEALTLAEKIMKTINDEAVKETERLAKIRGSFPMFEGSIYKGKTPRRNSTVTTIAPTGTISIIAGSSSGCEPLFAIAFQHIVKDKHLDRKMTFVNPKFEEVLKEQGLWSEEFMNKIGEVGIVRGLTELPEKIRQVFGTAQEITPTWHIRTQAAFQKYTENAVSKTINMDNGVTREDIKNAYLEAWDTGCKGITVFRDGCKDVQVLNIGTKNGDLPAQAGAKKEEMVVSPIVVEDPLRHRPYKVTGSTYRMNTPVGTAFITINEDELGEPLEVFVNVGKAGSDVAAMAEALGRTISTALKFRGTVSAKDKAREFADQLSGIGGRRSIGFGPTKIKSLPDALAGALSVHYGFGINGYHNSPNVFGVSENQETKSEVVATAPHISEKQQESLFLHAKQEKVGDICPSCGAGALVFEEGCSKCHACGHSEC